MHTGKAACKIHKIPAGIIDMIEGFLALYDFMKLFIKIVNAGLFIINIFNRFVNAAMAVLPAGFTIIKQVSVFLLTQ